MALETAIRLRCDSCQDVSEWFDGTIHTRADIIAWLHNQGWLRTRGSYLTRERTYCPTCKPNRSTKLPKDN